MSLTNEISSKTDFDLMLHPELSEDEIEVLELSWKDYFIKQYEDYIKQEEN